MPAADRGRTIGILIDDHLNVGRLAGLEILRLHPEMLRGDLRALGPQLHAARQIVGRRRFGGERPLLRRQQPLALGQADRVDGRRLLHALESARA